MVKPADKDFINGEKLLIAWWLHMVPVFPPLSKVISMTVLPLLTTRN